MRRVIDDSWYEYAKNAIMELLPICQANARQVSEFSYGSYRAEPHLIKNWLQDRLSAHQIKFGKVEHAHGIGNNNAWEIIYLGNPKEEQICGLFHSTDNMYGSAICWVSTFDEDDRTYSVTIRGRGK